MSCAVVMDLPLIHEGCHPHVRLQVQNADKPLYLGTFHCFQSIIHQESALGLYKGLGSPMMGLTFINVIVFGLQGNAISWLGPLVQPSSMSFAVQWNLPRPACRCRGLGRRSLRRKVYKNSLDCLVRIYKKEGIRSINRGMVTTLVRETPGFGVYFLTYDVLTHSLGCEPEDPYMSTKLLFAGGMSGIASWLSTYPVDVIKSRLQADRVGGVRQSFRTEGKDIAALPSLQLHKCKLWRINHKPTGAEAISFCCR
uniref:Solute carrier family 25 member 29 n=1 Tax=Monopterus albus TaxID=43700 RepID=A0A3Q3IXQ1_MONAL